MHVTTISKAALCSLGVLAAYGVSNKVAGTPQPESPKQEPSVQPSVAPKLKVEVAAAQKIAPPETIAPQLAITRDLAKERQQREAKLAQDLAKVSVPKMGQASIKPTLSEINIPDASHLPIDKIVAQSVRTTTPVGAALTHVRSVSAPVTPLYPAPAASPVLSIPSASKTAQASDSTATTASSARSALPDQPQPKQNLGNSTDHSTVQPHATETAPIARTESPYAQTAPTATLQRSPAQSQPHQQPRAALPSEAATGRSNIQLVAQTVTETVAETATQMVTPTPNETATQASSSNRSQPVSQPISLTSSQAPQLTANQPIARQPQIAQSTPNGAISAVSVDEAYTLGAGDQISLRFFNTPEYNGDVQVQADGTLNLPLVGSFSVAGMTMRQAEAEIASRYQSELRYAVVTVNLRQARPLQVAIVGEVQQPGSYTLSLLEGAQFPSIVQAIQTAGGTTQSADLRNVQVQRASRTNPGQTIAVNLVDLLQNGNLSQDLKLRDGDRIIIPTATTVDFAEAEQFAASNFAANSAQAFDIAIVGEVFRPGAYKIGGEGGRATVSQAIQLAGGVKPFANVRQIQIRRATRSGTEQVIEVDFWQLLRAGNLSQDLALQQGDRITIPTATASTAAETTLLTAANISPAAISVNVVGEVKSPGLVSVPPSSTLNQAILAAGGLNNRATREIELIRLESNGTLTRRTIIVDIEQGFNTSENPLLLSNDIIVVGRSGLTQFSDQFNQINSVIGPLLQLIPFRPF